MGQGFEHILEEISEGLRQLPRIEPPFGRDEIGSWTKQVSAHLADLIGRVDHCQKPKIWEWWRDEEEVEHFILELGLALKHLDDCFPRQALTFVVGSGLGHSLKERIVHELVDRFRDRLVFRETQQPFNESEPVQWDRWIYVGLPSSTIPYGSLTLRFSMCFGDQGSDGDAALIQKWRPHHMAQTDLIVEGSPSDFRAAMEDGPLPGGIRLDGIPKDPAIWIDAVPPEWLREKHLSTYPHLRAVATGELFLIDGQGLDLAIREHMEEPSSIT
jgi:hypothetical protein